MNNGAAVNLQEPAPPRGFVGELRAFNQIFRYAWPYWDKVLLQLFAAVMVAAIGVLPALFLLRIIDHAFVEKDIAELFLLTGATVLVYVTSMGLNFIMSAMGIAISMRVGLRFAREVYEGYLAHSVRFHEKNPVGDLMYRGSTDIQECLELISVYVPQTLMHLSAVLFSLSVVWALSGPVVIAVALYPVFHLLVAQYLVNWVRHFDAERRGRLQKRRGILQELLSAWLLTRAFGRLPFMARRYNEAITKVVRVEYRHQVMFNLFEVTTELIFIQVFIQFLRLFLGVDVIAGGMSMGELFAILALANRVLDPAKNLILALQRGRQRLVPGERLLQTVSVLPPPLKCGGVGDYAGPVETLEFDQVSFAYDDELVLENISFSARRGQKIALVGAPGAGKSTLISLLLRLHDARSGQVRIDGQDIRDFAPRTTRKLVAPVLQNNMVFKGSIRDNIAFGSASISDAELQRAAERAQAWEFIERLALGLDTVLLETGSLSGGQKQRLAIARAFAKDAPILALDEATSALDPINESRVLDALNELRKDRILILTAHSLMPIRDADLILVLEKGRVVQQGRHEDLMRHPGAYRNLWRVQEEEQV